MFRLVLATLLLVAACAPQPAESVRLAYAAYGTGPTVVLLHGHQELRLRMGEAAATTVVLHELGHLVGLAHVDE